VVTAPARSHDADKTQPRPRVFRNREAVIELVALTCVVIAAGSLPIEVPWFAGALLGSSIIHVASRPSRSEIAATVALAVGLAALRLGLYPSERQLVLTMPSLLGYFLGMASIAVLTWRGPSIARYGAVWFPVFVLLRRTGLAVFRLGEGPTTDGAMFLIDHAIGDPAYRLGQWLESYPKLWSALWAGYNAIPLTLPVAYGASLDDPRRCKRLLWSWAIAGMLGVLCYRIVPVSGPMYAFEGWPQLPAAVSWAWMDVPITRIRTGMPSLHLTWAILAWWFAPPAPPWVRPFLFGFVLLTLWTTLALGQHYLIDLVVALPFVVLVIELWSRPRRALVAGLATLACLLVLRGLVL
jgi:hypothetical protein